MARGCGMRGEACEVDAQSPITPPRVYRQSPVMRTGSVRKADRQGTEACIYLYPTHSVCISAEALCHFITVGNPRSPLAFYDVEMGVVGGGCGFRACHKLPL